ncbi:SH3 domain-containing protein [Nocardia sp. CS682]|uniref:SH3 domain-containing protein n=1 Tax=Nocardia sp. CS682 TaxID=1047172 RepID=UPI001074D0BA|nr:SH3 domain-containing protein [Nocardia sp. CS682]
MNILRRSGIFVMLTALSFLLALGGLWSDLNFTNRPVVDGADISYLTGEANVRTCPSVDCQSSEVFFPGQQVTVIRGPADNSEWSEIKYGDTTRFVSNKFLEPVQATPLAKWFFLAVAVAVGITAMVLIASASWFQKLAAKVPRRFDIGLIYFTLLAAVASCILGFFYAQAGEKSLDEFLGDVFTNLGAGFAGAAMTFALFQSLLSKRNVSIDQIDSVGEKLGSLEERVVDMRRAVDQMEARRERVNRDPRNSSRSPSLPHRPGRGLPTRRRRPTT